MSNPEWLGDFALRQYVWEIRTQASNVEMAVTRLRLSRHGADGNRDIFAACQSLLLHTVLISRILWPQAQLDPRIVNEQDRARARDDSNARGRAIRRELHVDGKAFKPLENRSMRNAMEHYDERLDRFFSENAKANIIDMGVGVPPRVKGPHAILRFYQTEPEDYLIVLGERLRMQELVDSVKLVAARADQWLMAQRPADSG